MELYASAFDQIGRLDKLEAFASLNGPAFYGLPVNEGHLTLKRSPYAVPQAVDMAGDPLVPLAAGDGGKRRRLGSSRG